MSVDIYLRCNLLVLIVLLLFHGLVELGAKAWSSNHRIEHSQVFCIDGLLLEQSLVQMILDPELQRERLNEISLNRHQFIGFFKEFFINLSQFSF